MIIFPSLTQKLFERHKLQWQSRLNEEALSEHFEMYRYLTYGETLAFIGLIVFCLSLFSSTTSIRNIGTGVLVLGILALFFFVYKMSLHQQRASRAVLTQYGLSYSRWKPVRIQNTRAFDMWLRRAQAKQTR
jgi:hypothetical protein